MVSFFCIVEVRVYFVFCVFVFLFWIFVGGWNGMWFFFLGESLYDLIIMCRVCMYW